MSVNPADHSLYLVDSGHNRILQVDGGGNVTTWLTPSGLCTGAINLYSFPTYSSIAWAPGGVAYLSAYLCGTPTSASAVLGVVERAANGALTWIAGQTSNAGNSTDGTLATSTYFPSLGAILLGPGATSLYVSVYQSNIVRHISALDGSGTVTTIAGNGSSGAYSGDYVPATTAQFYQPWSLAMTPTGHLVVADYYNYAFREIW
jgi:serine/threonine-protein kinase